MGSNIVIVGYNDLASQAPNIAAEWHPTMNGGFQPTDVTVMSNKKVWWLGKCGHEWQAAVCSRTKTNGTCCPYCANLKVLVGYNDLRTALPELAIEWHPTKNGELTPEKVVAKANKKVWWKCSTCGHEWQAVITKRANGQGCPLCAQGSRTSFPEKAIVYYLNKIGIYVSENYRDEWLNNFELDIFLPELSIAIEYDGYAWHQNIEKDMRKSKLCKQKGIQLIRIREDRCPPIDDGSICFRVPNRNRKGLNQAIDFVISFIKDKIGADVPSISVDTARDRMEIYDLMESRKQKNSFALMCPDLICEWNYEKNGSMSPEDVTPFSDKKVWWKCSEHGHEWEAVIKSRTKGSGCPVCAGNKVQEGFNDLLTIAPALAAEWHPTKNGLLKPSEVTAQSGTKVWWKCHTCGYEWQSAIYSRNGARHQGCPNCANKRVHEKLRTPKVGQSLLERDPVLAAQWHPIKNGDLKPENVTLKTHRKVWWLCSKGHEWEAPVYSRSSGNGCPFCYQNSRKKK